MKNRKVLIIVLFALLAIKLPHGEVQAVSLDTMPYDEWVRFAEKVVLGRIIARLPIKYESDNKVCGWEYQVEVDESWKGGNESFTIFTRNEDVFFGLNYNYLFIAFKNNNFSEKKTSRTNKKCYVDQNNVLIVDSIKYRTRKTEQMVFPLDTKAETLTGSRWLVSIPREVTPVLDRYTGANYVEGTNKDIIEKLPDGYYLINLDEFIDTVFKNQN